MVDTLLLSLPFRW